MKCNKCKKEIKKDSKFCTYCGNKIDTSKIVLSIILDIFLCIISFFLFLFCVMGWFNDKNFFEGLLFLVSAIATCPYTYRAISKYLKFLDKIYLRVIIIIVTFIIGMSITPSSTGQNTTNIAKDTQEVIQDSNVDNSEVNKNSDEKKAQEELEKQKELEEKAKQDALKKQQEEEKRKQEEAKRIEEEKAKQERIKNGETELKNGNFTLKAGHKGYYDGFAYYIEGEVINNKNRSYSYAQIEFNVYDKNGNQLGSALANINNLDANATWKFKAMALNGNAESIASYKVVDITAF